MRRFQGKTALVTGGSAGIGRATALAFAGEGARVVIADIQDEEGRNTVRMVQEVGGEAIYINADVSQESDVQTLVQKIVQTYGGIDFAVNNAGITGGSDPANPMSTEEWSRVIGINLTGVFLCMKYEIPEMLSRGGGAIVNTSSTMGLVGRSGGMAYAASKHGVLGLTKSVALTYAANNIRINAVCPGTTQTSIMDWLKTEMPQIYDAMVAETPVGRLARPEEVANAILWLCSDEASYCNGHALVVDGGFLAQ